MLTDKDIEKLGQLVETILDNRLEARLKPIEDRIVAVDVRIHALEIRLELLEKRLTSLEGEFYAFRADMNALFLSHDQRIRALESSQIQIH
jgi:predicted  nucleic acid-binding Zn-ribbon protein